MRRDVGQRRAQKSAGNGGRDAKAARDGTPASIRVAASPPREPSPTTSRGVSYPPRGQGRQRVVRLRAVQRRARDGEDEIRETRERRDRDGRRQRQKRTRGNRPSGRRRGHARNKTRRSRRSRRSGVRGESLGGIRVFGGGDAMEKHLRGGGDEDDEEGHAFREVLSRAGELDESGPSERVAVDASSGPIGSEGGVARLHDALARDKAAETERTRRHTASCVGVSRDERAGRTLAAMRSAPKSARSAMDCGADGRVGGNGRGNA